MSEAGMQQEIDRLMDMVNRLVEDRDKWKKRCDQAWDQLNQIEDILKP